MRTIKIQLKARSKIRRSSSLKKTMPQARSNHRKQILRGRPSNHLHRTLSLRKLRLLTSNNQIRLQIKMEIKILLTKVHSKRSKLQAILLEMPLVSAGLRQFQINLRTTKSVVDLASRISRTHQAVKLKAMPTKSGRYQAWMEMTVKTSNNKVTCTASSQTWTQWRLPLLWPHNQGRLKTPPIRYTSFRRFCQASSRTPSKTARWTNLNKSITNSSKHNLKGKLFQTSKSKERHKISNYNSHHSQVC